MKDTIVIIIATLVMVAIIASGMVSHENQKCSDSWDHMDAFQKCVDRPGCFYDAEMWFEAKKAHSYYEAFCKKEDKK